MTALIIKNTPDEGPGNLLCFFRSHGIDYEIIEAYMAKKINISDSCRYLVILGGPMGVYEMDRYSHLKIVARAIERALKREIKILGICLGAQLFAHVLGSRVYKGPYEEIGWCHIDITQSGLCDFCFSKFAGEQGNGKVFQWHHDTFDLPGGATRLASSSCYPQQAFRYKDSYGIQFHPEITTEMVLEWFKDRGDLTDIINDTDLLYYSYRLKARLFYSAFFNGLNDAFL
ncbi:MAG: type 1 glutamine amidotransferase [Syntrophorhabdaceae bacterium]|nr:type 1 glutamine amidotransferase [Syntrophorhabdaceae bacterium]